MSSVAAEILTGPVASAETLFSRSIFLGGKEQFYSCICCCLEWLSLGAMVANPRETRMIAFFSLHL